jgi:hypothetical protein
MSIQSGNSCLFFMLAVMSPAYPLELLCYFMGDNLHLLLCDKILKISQQYPTNTLGIGVI